MYLFNIYLQFNLIKSTFGVSKYKVMCLKKEELLVNELIHFLVNSDLKEDDRLPSERDMSEMLNTSRNTLRSAVKILQANGIIYVKPGSGYFLKSTLNLEQHLIIVDEPKQKARISDQLEGFFLFEPIVVELCTKRITEKEIRQLEHHLVALSKAILEGNTSKIGVSHKIIYQTISLSTENQVMSMVLEKFERMFESVSIVLSHISQAERSTVFAAHVNLVNGIKSKDPETASLNSQTLITLLAVLLNKYESIDIPKSISIE